MVTPRIRVLLTDDSLPMGGKEILLLEYLRHLDRGRFDVHLVTLTSRGTLLGEARTAAVHYFCPGRKARLDVLALLRLGRYVRAHRIELVQTNEWIDSLYVCIATIGYRIKRVSTVHGVVSGWRQRIHIAILRRFDRVICVSQSLRSDLVARGYSPHNLVVIHNGVDLEKFATVVLPPAGTDPVTIGMVGNIRKEKDILTLCRAVHRLIQTGEKGIEVRLIGGTIDREYEASVRRYCLANKIDGCIKFLGTREDIREQLSQLDIYIAPSRSETFGLALVEAMACGLPVVVSDIPAFVEITDQGKYGLHFQAGNDLQLAQCLDRLVKTDSLRFKYGQLARERAGLFSIEATVRKLEALYMHLCADQER